MANQIAPPTGEQNKVRLLSISFDPERDTPEKLKQYGLDIWARMPKTISPSGSSPSVRQGRPGNGGFFGLRYETDATDKRRSTHSLITAVISPEGKVTKILQAETGRRTSHERTQLGTFFGKMIS